VRLRRTSKPKPRVEALWAYSVRQTPSSDTESDYVASTPLVTIGGSIGDLWPPLERTYVFPIFACSFFISSFIAPLIGDIIAGSPYVSWHFTEWITFAWAALVVIIFVLFMPETYVPVMMRWKINILQDMVVIDRRSDHSLGEIGGTDGVGIFRSMGRPVRMLLVEPILDLFALYLVIVWAILFGFLPGYSYIFGQDGTYGLDQVAIQYLNHRRRC
jgi:hypothetical protein